MHQLIIEFDIDDGEVNGAVLPHPVKYENKDVLTSTIMDLKAEYEARLAESLDSSDLVLQGDLENIPIAHFFKGIDRVFVMPDIYTEEEWFAKYDSTNAGIISEA